MNSKERKKNFFFQKTNIFRAATMRLLKHFAFCRSGFQDKRNAGEKSGRKWVKMRQQVEAERKYKMRNSFRFRGRCRLDQDGAGKWNGKGGGRHARSPRLASIQEHASFPQKCIPFMTFYYSFARTQTILFRTALHLLM